MKAAMESGGSAYRWSLHQQCKTEATDGSCFNPVDCVTAAGVHGTLFAVYRTLLPAGPRERYGFACLSASEAGDLGAITPAMVFSAMKRLAWPRSDLVVQPPGGETLVNLATNFFTANTEPSTQTVTLLGQRVEIEATPHRYVWHWAAGGETGEADSGSLTTDGPGDAYPRLEVTHTYREADVLVHPWVDTVYAGRYRVNGGAWTTIPQTLTVAGDPVPLRIREATPVLVG
ncbi:MAG: hypothetical protein KDB63_02390 [Nocardioidaceae bacterium]|nr:hypothetical protein [Nocardioidaceae bacterium]